ncbi:hypothetical protein [Elizabethkingia ursingii]
MQLLSSLCRHILAVE